MGTASNPKRRIPLTVTDKILEGIGVLPLLCLWMLIISNYATLPDNIPIHFKSGWEPDGYGSKTTIIALPIVATLLYLVLTFVAAFPHKLNYAVTITEVNAQKQYSIFTRFFRVFKVAIVVIFFIIEYKTIQMVTDLPDVLGKSSMFLVFAVLSTPIFYFLIQSSKNASRDTNSNI